MHKRLPLDRDAQLRHMGEVRRAQLPGFVLLSEVHFLHWAFSRPPKLNPPLQGSDLPVGKPARVFPLQAFEQRLGFQTRTFLDLLPDPLPDIAEGILAGAPMPLPFQLAGQPVQRQISPRSFRIHPRFRGRNLLICFRLRQLLQPPYLVVSNHPIAPAERNPDGHTVVVEREF